MMSLHGSFTHIHVMSEGLLCGEAQALNLNLVSLSKRTHVVRVCASSKVWTVRILRGGSKVHTLEEAHTRTTCVRLETIHEVWARFCNFP